MQLVANAVVPLEGSSQVSARFKYDSEAGFTYNGTSVEANAKAGTFSIDKNIAQTGAAGAIGINWGIGFPRLELGMFGESLVPYVQTACLIGGDFTFTPPCQQARAQFIGSCGYNLKILGISVLSGLKTLWQQEKVLLKAGQRRGSVSRLMVDGGKWEVGRGKLEVGAISNVSGQRTTDN